MVTEKANIMVGGKNSLSMLSNNGGPMVTRDTIGELISR
jgi:hypothetical protein